MKGGQGRKSAEIKDCSGGLITKSPPKNIESKYFVDCQNVYAAGAMLYRRDGVTLVNPTVAAGAGFGMYNWIRGSATTNQWLMAMWGTALVKMDVGTGAWDGVWDPIVADSASGSSFTTAGGFTYFANYNGVLLISNDGYNGIQKMTTSDASYKNLITGGSGTAPVSKYVAVWKNHAWFINCLNSEDQIFHSAVNSYNNFDGSTAGSNNLITENDVGLTGWFVLNGRLYVTKSLSIHRFTYTGSPSPLVEIRSIKSTCGTKSPRSIKNVTTPEGEVVLFLGSNKKLYLCDGQDAQELSDGIDISNGGTVYMQGINGAALNNCFAVVHEDLNWYELFVCLGTATVPSYSIVYDYRMKSFWPMSARGYAAGCISDDGNGKRVVYAQTPTNGKAYRLNLGNSDDGAAINAYAIWPKMGVPTMLARIDEIEVETDSVACTPQFSWRADWESAWVTQTMKANTNSHNWGPGRIDNMIQFKIADNSTTASFKFWGITLSERVLGGGK